MKKIKIKTIFLILAFIIILSQGCGLNNLTVKDDLDNNMSANINISGSTALKPLIEEISKDFNKTIITVKGGDSETGLYEVLHKKSEICNYDTNKKMNIKYKNTFENLIGNKICGIGFAIVVNNKVKVNLLTKQQIQDIFKGKITNWQQVGGQKQHINIINRPRTSGSRRIFNKVIMDEQEENYDLGIIKNSNGQVQKAIFSTKGSIGYIALSYLRDKSNIIKPIKINNIEPTKENIISKKYPFWGYEYMYYIDDNKAIKEFVKYVLSDKNKYLIEKLGYILLEDLN